MHPPTGKAQPRRVVQTSTGPEKFKNSETRGEPLAKFWLQGLERPNPHMHTYGHRRGRREVPGVTEEAETVAENFEDLENRGEPLTKFWLPGAVRPPAPSRAPVHWDYHFGQKGIPVTMMDCNGGGCTDALSTTPPLPD